MEKGTAPFSPKNPLPPGEGRASTKYPLPPGKGGVRVPASLLPPPIEAEFQRALQLHQQGQLPAAAAIYQAILQSRPQHADALHYLGVVHYQNGNPPAALACIEQALAVRPGYAEAWSNQGITLHALQRYEEALMAYRQALQLRPAQADVFYNQGNALQALQRYDEALAAYRSALGLRPDYIEALNNYGITLLAVQRHEEALAAYDRALRINPAQADAHNNRGNALKELQRTDEALAAFDAALCLRPDHADALYNRANALKELQRYNEALEAYAGVLLLRPDCVEALNNRGNTLHQMQQFEAALAIYDDALHLRPHDADAHYNRANALHALKRYDEALEAYDAAEKHARHSGRDCRNPEDRDVTLNPSTDLGLFPDVERPDLIPMKIPLPLGEGRERVLFSAIYTNRGNTLKELKRFEQSLEAYDTALRLHPDCTEAFNNRGSILHELKRYNEALLAHDAALALHPDYADAHNNRGNALRALKRYDDALAAFASALRLDPELIEAHNNRGYVYFELQHYDEALAGCEAALRLQPDHADALNSRANIHFILRQCEQALQGFEAVMRVQPDYDEAAGMRLHCAMHLCAWEHLDHYKAQLFALLDAGKLSSSPFTLMAIDAPLQRQKQCAQRYAQERYLTEKGSDPFFRTSPLSLWERARVRDKTPDVSTALSSGNAPPKKIRIAYFSADWFNHATSYLMAELLEKHDRTRFEVIGYCYWRSPDDEMRRRIINAFDQFHSVHDLSDEEIAEHARANAIDIAVDLKGHTQYARLGIFAHRAAPVQIHYLGYPGTLGAPFIDYLIADPVVIPQAHQEHYAEKILYLPDSYQANDSGKAISERVFSRSELGLPETGFVFCCFNNNYKITPDLFDSWMRLLIQVEGSVLWLLESNGGVRKNLEQAAQARGVAAHRLVFAPWMSLPEHLARHARADLFLDTFYYNAHTTASDALWAGLPVLTRLGETFAGRVAASLLHAVGLPELVMPDAQAYEQMALQLATHPEQLQSLRSKLAANRLSSPLFDTPRFVRNIEQAYIQVLE
jgi:protein O-GlcNAc transferase